MMRELPSRFSGDGRGGNTPTGGFVVLEAVSGPGGEVYRFHATVEQHCEGAVLALRGEIRIVADPWAFGSAAVALALAGLVAAWIPARGAARVNPVEALRAE